MSSLISVLSAIFWGVIVLSVLVFVHEGGHYLAARACGMRVTEFFLGLPSRHKLSHVSKTHGTEIGVTPILLGGYTRICGMEGEQDELCAQALALVQQEGRISAREVASRLGIDEERAYRILAVLSDWASIQPYYDPEKGEHPGQADWPESFETRARDAEMRTQFDKGHDLAGAGSSADGEPRPLTCDPDEFLASERSHTYLGYGFLKRVFVLVAGPFVNLLLAFLIIAGSLSIVGVDVAADSNTIGSVEQGSLAEKAGLEAGDTITAIGDDQIGSWSDISGSLSEKLSSGEDFSITYEHDGQQETSEVSLGGEPAQALGIRAQVRRMRLGVGQSSLYALRYGQLVIQYAARLIMPQHMAETVQSTSSIVGISAAASQAAASGPSDLVMFVAAISMSLGAMNLLPIPPLDGGKVLLEIIELVRRKPLSLKAQTVVSYLGLAFFLVIFCFALKNDFTNIIG